MKKTIISLLLAMSLILSMSVSVFAVNDVNPLTIIKPITEQVMPE